ncbi:MAG: amidohydrolase family protein [Acidobacteria bacterium]|nr:amidohydrolase family protein [Acidobacteriota bacterium]
MKAALAFTFAAAAFGQELLIRNVNIHPVTAPAVANTSLLIRDGRIAEISPKIRVPKTVKALDAQGAHLYPGMIDSATNLGMNEISSVREASDISEIGDFNPQLRTLVAVNPASEHIPVARANGLTAAITIPSGGIIAGQAGLMHLDGWTWEEMEVTRSAAMHLRFPVLRATQGLLRGAAPGAPVTFAEMQRAHQEQLDKLRLFFENARRYQKSKAAAGPGFRVDLKFEAMLPVLDGKLAVLINAAREREIREALDFAQREGIKVILSGVREPGTQIARIKSMGVAVIVGETLALPLEEDDAYDSPFTMPAELHKAGILFAFATYNTSMVRNLPYHAAACVPFGLPPEEALKAVTINPAKIWGVADRTGSIETGKWADLILTDGDPLETRTQIKHMWIRGREISLESKHTRLYQKYLARP